MREASQKGNKNLMVSESSQNGSPKFGNQCLETFDINRSCFPSSCPRNTLSIPGRTLRSCQRPLMWVWPKGTSGMTTMFIWTPVVQPPLSALGPMCRGDEAYLKVGGHCSELWLLYFLWLIFVSCLLLFAWNSAEIKQKSPLSCVWQSPHAWDNVVTSHRQALILSAPITQKNIIVISP